MEKRGRRWVLGDGAKREEAPNCFWVIHPSQTPSEALFGAMGRWEPGSTGVAAGKMMASGQRGQRGPRAEPTEQKPEPCSVL